MNTHKLRCLVGLVIGYDGNPEVNQYRQAIGDQVLHAYGITPTPGLADGRTVVGAQQNVLREEVDGWLTIIGNLPLVECDATMHRGRATYTPQLQDWDALKANDKAKPQWLSWLDACPGNEEEGLRVVNGVTTVVKFTGKEAYREFPTNQASDKGNDTPRLAVRDQWNQDDWDSFLDNMDGSDADWTDASAEQAHDGGYDNHKFASATAAIMAAMPYRNSGHGGVSLNAQDNWDTYIRGLRQKSNADAYKELASTLAPQERGRTRVMSKKGTNKRQALLAAARAAKQ